MALYAFDGTRDDDEALGTDAASLAKETNVGRIYRDYESQTHAQGINSVYVHGVGTKFGAIGAVVGGAFGAGWLSRINETYDKLCAAYIAGDRVIDVVGFSRGSALALDFVNKINKDGVKKDGAVIEAHPAVRFLGLFDVVPAFGVASLGFIFSSFNPLHHLNLPANVQHCFHAMALDERRASFEVKRVAGAYEVWFRGVHSDIGGGNENLGHNNIALRWMYRKAIACGLRWMYRKAIACGLPLTMARFDDHSCVPVDKIRPNFFSDASVATSRSVNSTDWIHYTVAQHTVLSDEHCKKFPMICPVETEVFERERITIPAADAV
jgi:uncharacterized protein (DUF2235 family)